MFYMYVHQFLGKLNNQGANFMLYLPPSTKMIHGLTYHLHLAGKNVAIVVGSLVVGMLVFNSDDPSSNPADIFVLFCDTIRQKNQVLKIKSKSSSLLVLRPTQQIMQCVRYWFSR